MPCLPEADVPYELGPSTMAPTLVLHQPVCTVSVGLPAAVSSPPVPGGAAVSSPPVPGGVGQRCSVSVGQTTLMTLQDEGR